MKSSRVSSKGQVTIPVEVRKTLGIEPGDLIAYEMDGEVVKLKKLEPFDAAFHSAISETLQEWNSDEDEEAFGDL
ncbi:MAG: AbrB/MazE/SpoVT family DNA-binding domain-containing protein [Desulfobacterales bacterium]|nr:AbrB/MazE/SpoVT family DNA-binding domain-containing protein [Desulfobacterales bacterium]MCF8080440.1 AbrB/MazE/SpoVT family DNA-binding domain-containing protein [Desulfobacterales bacterium]